MIPRLGNFSGSRDSQAWGHSEHFPVYFWGPKCATRDLVQTLRFLSSLLIGAALGGCHLVKRTEQCASLQQIFRAAAPALKAESIAGSPPAKTLLRRATIYEQLAKDVQGHRFDAPRLQEESRSTQDLLNKLATDLKAAAATIDRATLAEESLTVRQETNGQGRSNAHSAITVQQRRYQQLKRSMEATSLSLNASLQSMSALCH